jgi:hypothetical protein
MLRGAVILDVSSDQLEAVRSRLARARLPTELAGGHFEVHADGRVSYALPTFWWELGRVAQAVGLATCVGVATSLALGWMFTLALPAGFLVGAGWAVATLVVDRQRRQAATRRFLRALGRESVLE